MRVPLDNKSVESPSVRSPLSDPESGPAYYAKPNLPSEMTRTPQNFASSSSYVPIQLIYPVGSSTEDWLESHEWDPR